jgi:glutaconate CoA-transferase subunit B
MVAAASREIRDGDKVFVGMRLPLLGFAVAKETHAPKSLGIFENGIIRDWPALESILTMSDPPNVARALSCGGLNDVMHLLQSNRVDLGFIGGAEVDRFGNLNTHWVQENGKRIQRWRCRYCDDGQAVHHHHEPRTPPLPSHSPLHHLSRLW